MKPSQTDEVIAAIARVLRQVDCPLVDSWGCTHQGHVMTIVERLGEISGVMQDIAMNAGMPGAARNYRADLVVQVAELAANVVVMLTEELVALRAADDARSLP